MRAALLERGIRLLSDERAEPLAIFRRKHGRVSAAVGLGRNRAGAAVALQQPRDEGDTDQEPFRDLADGSLTAQDRIDDPLSEIGGIGCHRSPPHRNLPSNGAPSN